MRTQFIVPVLLFVFFGISCLRGNLNAQQQHEKQIAIVPDEDKTFVFFSTDDGTQLSHYFVLQGTIVADGDITPSSFIKEKEYLAVFPSQGAAPVVFTLTGNTGYSDAVANRPDAVVHEGYGLARVKLPLSFDYAEFVDAMRAGTNEAMNHIYSEASAGTGNPVTDDPQGLQCRVGGCGSTSCGYSGEAGPVGISCEVSCASGYYACCGGIKSVASCACYKDTNCN